MTDRRTSGSSSVIKILADTNFWLDYYLVRNERHVAAMSFVKRASESEGVALYAASLSIKDAAYLLAQKMKAYARQDGRDLTDEVIAAAREAAWGCVRSMSSLAIIIPVGYDEVMQAFTYREVHDDFEDDLILGAAARARVDYVLTRDQGLARHSPVRCIDVEEALTLVR